MVDRAAQVSFYDCSATPEGRELTAFLLPRSVGSVDFRHPLVQLGYDIPVSNEHFYGDPKPVEVTC